MMRKILVVGSALAFLAVGSVSQEKVTPPEQEAPIIPTFQDGNHLLAFCEDKSDIDFCLGYITGSADHFAFTKALLKFAKIDKGGGTCVPERVTPQQLIDIFVKYAKNHPEERHEPGQQMIISAWHEAFPCK